MRIHLSIKLDKPLELPTAYHHILQSIIYELLSDESGNSDLHDNGTSYKKRCYKQFTFSDIKGHYEIKNRNIIFDDRISFYIGAYDSDLIKKIETKVAKDGIRWGNQITQNITTTIEEKIISDNEILIRMISPICVYETNDETKHTHYFTPRDEAFYNAVSSNFNRKYEAQFGERADEDIRLSKIDVRSQDKCITKYKGYIIEAYSGTYKLAGKPEYLNYLYQVGLGSKNSQGFGMFEIID